MSSDIETYLAEVEKRARAATGGPWRNVGMGGESYVLAPSHKWHKSTPGHRGYPVAIPRTYHDGESIRTDHSSAGFAHDDATFIAHARTDIPRLVAELRKTRAALQDLLEWAEDFRRDRVCPTYDALSPARKALEGGDE